MTRQVLDAECGTLSHLRASGKFWTENIPKHDKRNARRFSAPEQFYMFLSARSRSEAETKAEQNIYSRGRQIGKKLTLC